MKSGKLTARAASTTKPGKYGDGAGLWLVVSESGAARWVYRFTIAGKVSEAGLGSRDVVSLAEARDKAAAARKLAKSGLSPVEERRKAATAMIAKPTFGDCATALIKSKESAWRNAVHRQQWSTTLQTHAASLWSMPIDKIDEQAVLSVLTPIWTKTPETASRVRARIEAVLDSARAQKLRMGENPARWRGHLVHLLPRRPKIEQQHHPAMAYQQIPAFMAQLRQDDSITALCLQFCILTATRSGEARGARWDEIDFEARLWVIPGGRMKSGVTHRVPLADGALAILEKMAAARVGDLVFMQRADLPLAATSLRKCLIRVGGGDFTVHGFRSSFRDFAADETHHAREIAEAALAHATGDQTERAYRRSDALEKRRALMDAWATFCEPTTAAGNVVRLR
jgi:integrase